MESIIMNGMKLKENLKGVEGQCILIMLDHKDALLYVVTWLQKSNLSIIGDKDSMIPRLREMRIRSFTDNSVNKYNEIFVTIMEKKDVSIGKYKMSNEDFWLIESADIVFVVETFEQEGVIRCIKDRTKSIMGEGDEICKI